MADVTGQGTLADADGNELGAVAFRIRHDGDPAAPVRDWRGDLEFADDAALEPGAYVLAAEDGTRGDVEIEPVGSTAGGARQFAFTGIGVWGRPSGE